MTKIFAAALSLTLLAPGARANAQILSITNATVVDVSNGALNPGMTVVIQGNRIVRVARTTSGSGAAGTVVDAHGMFLIPGLWDMHTHVYFGRKNDDGTDLTLPLFIVNGVTGIRDMGSNLDAILKARDEVAVHRMLGPRMIVSGPMLDGPQATYTAAIAVKTADDGRRAVDLLKQRGVDFIKIQSNVPREAYFAIADEAKKVGIDLVGHVPDAVRASEAINAGQRSFEHLIGIFEASSPDEDKYIVGKKAPGMFLETYDAAREASIIRLVAEHQVWQCPTLFWERGQWLVDVIDWNKDPDLAYAWRSWVAGWPRTRAGILKSLDTDPIPVRERFVTHELDIVRKMHSANVPFLAGTDTPAGVDVIPGISLHLELQRFVDAGFTPLEALQTATVNPAKFMGRTNDYGAIEAGRIADLVLLERNPLVDISNTRTIRGVVTDGRYMSDSTLTALRSRLKTLAATR